MRRLPEEVAVEVVVEVVVELVVDQVADPNLALTDFGKYFTDPNLPAAQYLADHHNHQFFELQIETPYQVQTDTAHLISLIIWGQRYLWLNQHLDRINVDLLM